MLSSGFVKYECACSSTKQHRCSASGAHAAMPLIPLIPHTMPCCCCTHSCIRRIHLTSPRKRAYQRASRGRRLLGPIISKCGTKKATRGSTTAMISCVLVDSGSNGSTAVCACYCSTGKGLEGLLREAFITLPPKVTVLPHTTCNLHCL